MCHRALWLKGLERVCSMDSRSKDCGNDTRDVWGQGTCFKELLSEND